ncbi:MAG TPA: mechanosensitive ion channel domain-containing protein [Bacteroidales bacterium]|nr:mechanosensitive ion channel domain-containing protein [Bacteroidales bacterium]
MNQLFNKSIVDTLMQTALLFAIAIVVYFIYVLIYSWLWKRAGKTSGTFDDLLLKLFRSPLLIVIYLLLFNVFLYTAYKDLSFFSILLKIRNLAIVFTLTLLSLRVISATAYYLQLRYDLTNSDNLKARKNLTQLKVFKAIAVTLVVIIAIGAALMTFEQARKVGLSVLTSAGIMGIIVGFAAQKSLGMILAGIQLAITQPIRLDDLVIIEGEFGRIEEIQLTYVVMQIWDERRLILPVNWFLEKPFQNLTRSSASATGSIFLYLDYSFPVDSLRNVLPVMLKSDSNWDGRIAVVQVTDTKDRYKEVRILLSSDDSSKNWNLRTTIREKMIDFINSSYPDAFCKTRITQV